MTAEILLTLSFCGWVGVVCKVILCLPQQWLCLVKVELWMSWGLNSWNYFPIVLPCGRYQHKFETYRTSGTFPSGTPQNSSDPFISEKQARHGQISSSRMHFWGNGIIVIWLHTLKKSKNQKKIKILIIWLFGCLYI